MLRTLCLHFIVLVATVHLVCTETVPASSSLVTWLGRAEPSDVVVGGVAFDWEGVRATVRVANFSYVTVDIHDNCPGSKVGGGSRWAVHMTPSDLGVSPPNHRVATFLSGKRVHTYYLFNDPSRACGAPRCPVAWC